MPRFDGDKTAFWCRKALAGGCCISVQNRVVVDNILITFAENAYQPLQNFAYIVDWANINPIRQELCRLMSNNAEKWEHFGQMNKRKAKRVVENFITR
ncbi:MAG: hypothetical protein IJE29_02650 [Firmicutes bacterium]|nr:hypothetical protein [Bacillota bacterium]